MGSLRDTTDRLETGGHRVDHLVVLVGTNPLPNLVAIRLLLRPGGHVSLVHSKGQALLREGDVGTRPVAENLRDALCYPVRGEAGYTDPFADVGAEGYPVGVRRSTIRGRVHFVDLENPSCSKDVAVAVRKALAGVPGVAAHGVHYSGGTKTMSGYAILQAVREREAGRAVSLSHLDARRFELVFDAADPLGSPPVPVSVAGVPAASLSDLVRAHGLKELSGWYEPGQYSSGLGRVDEEFLAAYRETVGRAAAGRYVASKPDLLRSINTGAWRSYFDLNIKAVKEEGSNAEREALRRQKKRLRSISEVGECVAGWEIGGRDIAVEQMTMPGLVQRRPSVRNGDDSEAADRVAFGALGRVQATLEGVLESLDEGAGVSPVRADGVRLFRSAQLLGFHHPGTPDRVRPYDFVRWLDGGWLETTVARVLKDGDVPVLDEVAVGFEVKPGTRRSDQFELDVVAMHGYQLLAVSCTTSTKKATCKLKLFEAIHRARQLGGDEARVALVCGYEDTVELRNEVFHAFDRGARVAVFGFDDLGHLGDRLGDWLRDATRPGA